VRAPINDAANVAAADRAQPAHLHELCAAVVAAGGVTARAEARGARLVHAHHAEADGLVGLAVQAGHVWHLEAENGAQGPALVALEEVEHALGALVRLAVAVAAGGGGALSSIGPNEEAGKGVGSSEGGRGALQSGRATKERGGGSPQQSGRRCSEVLNGNWEGGCQHERLRRGVPCDAQK